MVRQGSGGIVLVFVGSALILVLADVETKRALLIAAGIALSYWRVMRRLDR
jgi:hypothetical protein